MSKRAVTIAIWCIILLTALVTIFSLYTFYLNWDTPVPESWGVQAGIRRGALVYLTEVVFLAIYIWLPTILGAMIVRRQPKNPIGWIYALTGFSTIVMIIVREITIYTNFTAPQMPIGLVFGMIQQVIWVVPFLFVFWLLSIFPDGVLPPPRWRWINALIVLFVTGVVTGALFQDPMQSAFQLSNPLPLPTNNELYFNALFYGGLTSLAISIMGLSALFITRFRKARGIVRQQYKWLGLSVSMSAGLLIAGTFLGNVVGLTIGEFMAIFSLVFVSLGAGFAVLRFGLYDVDLIIRKTLVYSLITATLAIVYIASIVALQSLVTGLTGGQSPLVIVISTLLIAALFNPLRRRIQGAIDRRFYRAKYNAEQALDTFAATVRAEVDLDELGRELARLVHETMQPQHLSFWLREMGSSQTEDSL